jgi:hypothetical protein
LHALWGAYLFFIGIVTIYDALSAIGFWDLEVEVGIGINIWIALQYVFLVDTSFFMTSLTFLIISGVLTGFFIYHMWLISQNLTTNEHIKLSR